MNESTTATLNDMAYVAILQPMLESWAAESGPWIRRHAKRVARRRHMARKKRRGWA